MSNKSSLRVIIAFFAMVCSIPFLIAAYRLYHSTSGTIYFMVAIGLFFYGLSTIQRHYKRK